MTKSLPSNIDAERFVLGSILLDDSFYAQTAGTVEPEDFSLEKHRRIFKRMGDLNNRGETIDRLTLFDELMKFGELEACDGLGYIVSLDDGLPHVPNIDSYVRIVKDKAVLRRIIFASQHTMDLCLQGQETPDEILARAGETLLQLGQERVKHGDWTNPYDVVRTYPGGAHGFVARKQGGVGIALPWAPLTELLGGGLHAGELVIVAGRPSMGKSIVGMQIALQAAKDKHGAAVFSLEMSKESLTERLLCGMARVDNQRLRAGYLNQAERLKLLSAAADLEELPLFIDDTRARTIPDILSALRKLLAKKQVAVVIVDHLQLMTAAGRRREQKRNDELSEVCHEFKHAAGALGVTAVVLSQLNRQCEIENRRPQLSDLKETGSVEEDGDVVLFVHRPERYAKNHGRDELRGLAEFIIAKQRKGPVGKRDMVFLDSLQKFECQAHDLSEPIPYTPDSVL